MNRSDVTLGFFLTFRYLRRSNPWTTILITFVMVLTFLNLTVIGGLLEGIVVGSFVGLRDRAIGDVVVSVKSGETYVGRSQHIIRSLRGDSRVASLSPRYSTTVEVIAEGDVYNVTNANDQRRSVKTVAFGVDADAERSTINLPDSIIEGSYFSGNNRKELLIGSALLERYSPFGSEVLPDVHSGDYVYLRKISSAQGLVSGSQYQSVQNSADALSSPLQKYIVRGIYRTKAGEIDIALMMDQNEVRSVGVNPGNNVNSIAVRLKNPDDAVAVRDSLYAQGFGRYAKIETVNDAIGPFLDDIRTVFRLLGSIVGAIGLAVASITIFIIIFVTAVSRSRYIGILKAIGITPSAIRLSYVFYALSFAGIGCAIGLTLLFGLFVPFFEANPIPFPFSDGILYVTPTTVLIQVALIIVATAIAGLIPAHRVVRRPSIDSVRGRE
ncbi:MAG: FtsX-like permease family protein [Candidatus Kaiserbacteria bacterium]|nr:FtsX-like permease family protein [Candidatus Kaiserbacteria bacterium]